MPWRKGLSPEQITAAGHVGSHARLLAGPGTGKTRTLTHRILALMLDHAADPQEILAVTFTRVAAFQLRQELQQSLGPLGIPIPRVCTLHSFALRQLLRNTGHIKALPQPLRIADDWEERNIIQEDIKYRLVGKPIREVQELFRRLSADWETLRRDSPDWEGLFPDPAFLGAWREHRTMFGYTLRSELVYQLSRALNQYPSFALEASFQHILVDEYQDLNACDLRVIHELATRGCEVYAVGDDDQSIYGFRYADPEGIRRFPGDYPTACSLALEVCYRCDRSILKLSQFVASLDPDRLPKKTIAHVGAGEGEVYLLCFADQHREAWGVAQMCRHLIQTQGVKPDAILILLRSDQHRALSSVLRAALAKQNVAVAEHSESSPLDDADGRRVLAILRLLVNEKDDLAWRTILQLHKGIGPKTLAAVRDEARKSGLRFAALLQELKSAPERVKPGGNTITKAVCKYETILDGLSSGATSLEQQLETATDVLVSDIQHKSDLIAFLRAIAVETGVGTLQDFINALGVSMGAAEQELAEGFVNIMTMHKAKGLSADVVFIVGAEDEFIPGRNEGEKEADERRLLFVSMTRAKHRLFITYCEKRTGQQAFMGRESGQAGRSLTRFLRDAPIQAASGIQRVSSMLHQNK